MPRPNKPNIFEKIILELDKALQTRANAKSLAQRSSPEVPEVNTGANDTQLNVKQKNQAARLMRVNHSGEVAAQALYQGQAFTARLDKVRTQMQQAAAEEIDHLAWCEERLDELNAKPSVVNPLWYAGSFTLGAIAGLAGARWSLGFVEETEKQVVEHIQEHLDQLPEKDLRTRSILEQMQADEAEHGDIAKQAGASELPRPIKALMRLSSKIMTKSSYWV